MTANMVGQWVRLSHIIIIVTVKVTIIQLCLFMINIFLYGTTSTSPFNMLNSLNNFQDGSWHDYENRGQDFDRNNVATKATSYKNIQNVCWSVKMKNTFMLLLFSAFSVLSVFIVFFFKYQYFRIVCSFGAMRNIVCSIL